MMERRPERAWEDYEKIELFTNIIKRSAVSPEDLFRFIAHQQVVPSWDHTPLPHDRTKAECERQFDFYKSRFPYSHRSSLPGPPAVSFAPAALGYAGPARGRYYEAPPVQQPGGRPLLPKTTPSTPSEAGPAFPQSPMAEAPAQRKRGRPPKEEVSRRKAEAELRGEPYPPPRSKRRNRATGIQEVSLPVTTVPLVPAPSQPTITTPTGAPPAETGSESSGSKRRRLRPADIDVGTTRPQSQSYESPPTTSFTPAQPSASTTSGRDETDVRIEGREGSAPPQRSQLYRDIVGITRTSS